MEIGLFLPAEFPKWAQVWPEGAQRHQQTHRAERVTEMHKLGIGFQSVDIQLTHCIYSRNTS